MCAKLLQNTTFFAPRFSQVFQIVARVAARLLHTYSVRHILNRYAVPAMLEETAGSLINSAFGLMYLTGAVV